MLFLQVMSIGSMFNAVLCLSVKIKEISESILIKCWFANVGL